MLVIIQLVSVIASVAGIVFYFLGTEWVAILCGSITLIDSILQCASGRQNNMSTEFLTGLIGLVIAILNDLPEIPCIGVSLCIGNIAMLIGGWIAVLIVSSRTKHR